MKIVYDIKQMKVGCVLIQAVHGCSSALVQLFPTESWFLAPTPDMKVYEINKEQLKRLIEMTKKAHKKI